MGVDLDLTKVPNNKAIAITLIVFTSVLARTVAGRKVKEDKWPTIAILASLFSAAPWYLPCAFTFDRNLSLKSASKIALDTEIGGIVLVYTIKTMVAIFEKRVKANTPAHPG